jgi:hypothetical protein
MATETWSKIHPPDHGNNTGWGVEFFVIFGVARVSKSITLLVKPSDGLSFPLRYSRSPRHRLRAAIFSRADAVPRGCAKVSWGLGVYVVDHVRSDSLLICETSWHQSLIILDDCENRILWAGILTLHVSSRPALVARSGITLILSARSKSGEFGHRVSVRGQLGCAANT